MPTKEGVVQAQFLQKTFQKLGLCNSLLHRDDSRFYQTQNAAALNQAINATTSQPAKNIQNGWR